MRVLLASASLFLVLTPALPAQGTPTAKADSLQWGPAPAVFPAGAKMAVVSGDPSKPGPFVIQLAMPDGYRLAPHFHPTAETVEVKQGTFLYAMGDTFDLAKTKPMNVGEKGSIPANVHHYATAKGATVVAVTSTGPFALTYVNPADNPQQPAAKP
jgi:quercetin dioxygenase-like cupin family protein